MKKVWLAQLKCHNNHTLLAVAGEIEDADAGVLERLVREGYDEMVEREMLPRECGLCNCKTFHVDLHQTPFKTAKEAMPALAESQRQQMITAEYIRQSKN